MVLGISVMLTYQGAGFVVPVAGKISLMPGTDMKKGARHLGSMGKNLGKSR